MRLKEIEQRLSQIRQELNNENADITALSTEADALIEERNNLMAQAQTRQALLNKIGMEGGEGDPVVEEPEHRTLGVDSAEYRTGFLKKLRGMDLSNAEKRALTTASTSAGSVVPTTTANKIIEKVKTYAPLLDKIDLMHVPGTIKIPAEGTTIEAQIHAQNAVIASDDEKLSDITLSGFEVTKLITISKSVEKMSMDAFEAWLVRKIARAVADKITKLILFGTGSNQAQGINAITWDDTNSVTVGKSASLTEANVLKVIGLLNAGYDAGAEWIMSKNTFMNDFYPLMNTGKNNLVTFANGKYYVGGYPVEYDDRMTASEAILGNLELGYAGNMPEEVNVTSQFVTRENSYDFLGAAMFDGKVSAIEAFVKIVKATA